MEGSMSAYDREWKTEPLKCVECGGEAEGNVSTSDGDLCDKCEKAEGSASRLLALTELLQGWIDEDWDQPTVHCLREAMTSLPEDQQERAAKIVAGDLRELRVIIAGQEDKKQMRSALLDCVVAMRNAASQPMAEEDRISLLMRVSDVAARFLQD